jgi:hypothetical protein
MEQFPASLFFELANYLKTTELEFSSEPRPLEPGALRGVFQKEGQTKTVFEAIRMSCADIGLAVSVKLIDQFVDSAKELATTTDVAAKLSQIREAILLEMEDRLFMYIPSDRASYYDQKELFGKDTNTKFPTIQFDMVEAGNCYAAGRGTAVVFHLMRIMEIGVQQLGTKLGVALASDKNWQPILNEVDKAIKALPHKSSQTVELSAIAANLYAVRLAWRNKVMHPNDTYTLEEAENLIRHVKLFMQNLAKVL